VTEPANPRSPKGEQTRATIVAAALALFRERGFEKTTMRAVADTAGVSLGNAYHYFASKEHLVQAFYDQIQVQHEAAAAPVLARETTFARRLQGVQEAFLDVAEPYQEFGGKFFKTAAEPSSPLSPFSPESSAAREASIGIYRAVVEGSDLKVPPSLRQELPELLWLLHMGTVLFWVYDASPGQRRTRLLVRQSVPLVDTMLRLTRIPGVRGAVGDLVGIIRTLKSS
jgi:AcrR family transcriptional regulator